MQFIADNHNLRHESSSSPGSAASSAGVSHPPNSSTSPPPYSLPLPLPPATLVFSPSPGPNPILDNVPALEVPRQRRGRPRGSKNKPKNHHQYHPPSPIPFLPSLRTLLLQVEPNHDVIESLIRFCRTSSISLSVLSASGSLSYFVIRHPSCPSNLYFDGMFEILSISATILDSSPAPSPSFYFPITFTVTVSGMCGKVIGGPVSGPMVAAGPVFIVAASSSDKPTYHRLPEIEEGEGGNDEVLEGNNNNNKRQHAGLAGGGGTYLSGSDGAVWGSPVVARPPY